MTKITYWILGLLMAVLGWVWTVSYSKLSAIQQQLLMIQVELAKVQAVMIDRDEVKSIVRDELLKHGIK